MLGLHRASVAHHVSLEGSLPAAGPGTEGPRAAMTTGDCCHLPGSLCDCPGSAALSKSVEESDMGRPQYITQVTAKDGRLLSTVIKALGAQSDGPICRICHEGGNGEGLLSPCDCTGTLGTVHKSCLEKWLSSSNTSYCELCHTEFVVERRPRPLTERGMDFLSHYCQLAKALGFQWFTTSGILGLSVSTVKEMMYSVVVSAGEQLA
ncbi:E3 ubiquitin-protein ligase MARCHF2 isoform X4 [Haemorhous mexicanus]|uniref:E3 ubiquitin-protein ligase MARCHF2 isoform X4 n=1 Tax=Haemorhous mexicanus TaxID=30427 RepID=UPI0028BD3179|nr:E3 ubiquitin-protein ligase MARCHF2 isoform X4 [Haemorhous mexicanus]